MAQGANDGIGRLACARTAKESLSIFLRITVSEAESGGARRKTKVFDVDQKDVFWVSHKGSPFPQVRVPSCLPF